MNAGAVNVAGMVSQLNTALSSSAPFRHGSAAREPSTSRDRTGSRRSQSATAATRERDRLRRNDPGLTPQFVRPNAAGHEETGLAGRIGRRSRRDRIP